LTTIPSSFLSSALCSISGGSLGTVLCFGGGPALTGASDTRSRLNISSAWRVLTPSLCMTQSIAVPPLRHPRQFHLLVLGVIDSEGLLSLWKGHRPIRFLPMRRNWMPRASASRCTEISRLIRSTISSGSRAILSCSFRSFSGFLGKTCQEVCEIFLLLSNLFAIISIICILSQWMFLGPWNCLLQSSLSCPRERPLPRRLDCVCTRSARRADLRRFVLRER